jgi:lipopolysaccharide export system permease protein
VISRAEQTATELRASALTAQIAYRTNDGFWTRNENSYINVHTVLSDGRLAGVLIYEFDDRLHLNRITRAQQARYVDDHWELQHVERTEFKAETVISRQLKQVDWQTLLDPHLLDVVAVKPENLSATGLYHYVQYLSGNGLDTARYEMELWVKVILPLATGVMVFLAVPFVFGSLRAVGIGQRIMLGTMLGITFYMLNQIFNYASLVYQFNPVVSAVLPTILFFGLGVILLRRMA